MNILILFIALLSCKTMAQSHHPQHNMIMMGVKEIFISHIVYKVPHNYQVLLKIQLEPEAQDIYLNEKRAHPDDLMILFLDHMHIGDIQAAEGISGTILRVNEDGQRAEVLKGVKIPKSEYKILYFDEVPTQL